MASSSFSPPVKNYDVFISFREPDTRKNIVSHLLDAFCLRDIFSFIDNERIEAGDIISDQLIQAINTSWFAVVVISKDYATSKWCLEELRLIMELHRDKQIQVIPMFYGVEPSDVGNQKGSFEAAFKTYECPEQTPNMTPNKIADWRRALKQISELSGIDSNNCRNEADMIKKIVGKISRELLTLKPEGLINLVGMRARMETMSGLLNMESKDEAHMMIGIVGMAGVGKTTVAKCLYDQFSPRFPARCFIRDVSKIYMEEGPYYLKEKFHVSILSGETRFQDLRARLGNQPIFVVLDDVDKVEHVHIFAKQTSWFCPGSRIIITTRDRGLLNSLRVKIVHEVKCLSDKDSLEVFENIAFRGEDHVGFDEVSIRASRLAYGLPSALQSYAEHFREKETVEEWEDELSLLEKFPQVNVEKILRKSYDELWEPYQTAFLLVACFFNKYPFNHVTSLLDDGRARIKHLVGKSLISISMDGCISMHSLVVQIGREIVRQASNGRPSKQRFLWDAKEIYNVLGEEDKGTYKIEGVTLHMCDMPSILPMSTEAFLDMKNLNFLKFFQHLADREAKLQLNLDLYFPRDLRLLHWDAYPLKQLPSSLELSHLVQLNLRYSNLESLWDWTVDLHNLLRLDMTGSRNLRGLPDLSTAKNLEELVVEGCTRLERIPESLIVLANPIRRLKKLNVSHCDFLRGTEFTVNVSGDNDKESRAWRLKFPAMKEHLILPESISIDGQICVESFHFNGNAEHLSYSRNQEKTENQWSMKFSYLDTLYIKRYSYKKHLVPFKIYSFQLLTSLTELNLSNLNIYNIPQDIRLMKLVKKMDLSGNDFKYLPTTMREITNLKYLNLRNCSNLKSLPQLTQVETLILSDCENLQTVLLLHVKVEHSLRELWLDNWRKVKQMSEELCYFAKLTYLDLSRHEFVEVPSSIKELSSLGTLLLNNCKKLESLHELPESLKFLSVEGCDSLESITLTPNHSIKRLCHRHCPRLKLDEHMIARFSNYEDSQEVSPRFSTFPRTKVASHFDNEAIETSSRINHIDLEI